MLDVYFLFARFLPAITVCKLFFFEFLQEENNETV